MRLLYFIFSFLTAMIGYTIHGSIFWSIIDFLFVPFAWAKWIFFHEITSTVVMNTFPWFFV